MTDTPQEQTAANSRGRARDRHKKRKERQAMVVRGGTSKPKGTRSQILPQDRFKLPSIRLPQSRFLLGIPLAFLVVVGVIVALSLFKNEDPEAFSNAMWLDKTWTYGVRSEEDINALVQQLKQNKIGTVYAYVSTLNINNNWTGGQAGSGSFMQSRDGVEDFVALFKQAYPESRLYGWIEIWTTLDNDDGYRLDDPDLQSNVADFSERIIIELGFDGVFLDVKPLFTGNDDFVSLLRQVRSTIGFDAPIAIVVPADLTPEDVAPISSIAPGTIWDDTYKQRVMISANEIVVTVYQSYRDNPLDYINWVAYQVETYVNQLADLDLLTKPRIIISIPNYQTESDAHDPVIETIAAALDGINVGLGQVDEEMQSLLTGVAIFSDRDVSDSQWDIYRQKWLDR